MLTKRIEKIKQALRKKDLKQGAKLLIATLASDDMFSYWSSCCQGSERVPKILKYIREISFDEALPTACIDLVKGRLKLGVGFFLDQIQAPEDFLFILIHERNHLILARLYPEVQQGSGYLPDLFNFAQDAYINAAARRNIVSTLPERFYHDPAELILTGCHSKIDWPRWEIKGDNPLKEAHQGIYWLNFSLLTALGERLEMVRLPGYRQWMDLMAEWYEESRGEAKPEAGKVGLEQGREGDPMTGDQKEAGEAGDESPGNSQETETPARGLGEQEEDQAQEEASPENPGHDQGSQSREEDPLDCGQDLPAKEGLGQKARPSWPGKDKPLDAEALVKSYVPLVENPPERLVPNQVDGLSRDEYGLNKIPIPDFKPDDPVVELILETSEEGEWRDRVRAFENQALKGVEKAIRGILSDQAIEKAYQGYSIQVPALISRKNLLSLSLGDFPVIWDKGFEVKAPRIDLYVDVSGSMDIYYGYIPYIYDALRRVRGRIFQFSTEVVEADPDDRWLHTTGGTNFDLVAEHILANRIRSLILVSDGCDSINKANLNRLQDQIESLVYLKVKDNDRWNWEEIASQTIVLNKGGD